MVDGKHMKTCLGDLYSINWMEDSDTATGIKRTLDEQLTVVKKETNKSHVTEYGTVGSFSAKDTCNEYQGNTSPSTLRRNRGSTADAAATAAEAGAIPKTPHDAVDSRDIPLVTAFYSYLWAEEGADKAALAAKLTGLVHAREEADRIFSSILRTLEVAREVAPVLEGVAATTECEKQVYSAVDAHCGWFDEYSLKYSSSLIERCADVPFATIEVALRHHCLAGKPVAATA